MREQHLLDICMLCVAVPFEKGSPFSTEDIQGGHHALHQTCRLAQRLLWQMLRQCNANRRYASKYVSQMQVLLGYSIGVASTLTEVFTDNEELLDSIDDQTIEFFLELIRGEDGRQARYLDFLICLCHSGGKAVRVNQWRIAQMLVHEAPELLITLRLGKGGQVYVEGDPAYFPKFKESGVLPLAQWIKTTADTTKLYFERSIDLLGDLCDGRNLRNTPLIREKLPYELVMAVIKDDQVRACPACALGGAQPIPNTTPRGLNQPSWNPAPCNPCTPHAHERPPWLERLPWLERPPWLELSFAGS